jgi:sugar phosphate isomerase/epimerase
VPDHLNVGEYSSNDKFIQQSSAKVEKSSSSEDNHALLSRFSLSQMTTRRWSTEQDVQAACDLGLKNIGLWRLKYEDFGETETAELLEKHRMNVSSISWIGGFTSAHGYLIDDCMREAVQVIRYASWLGAKTVVVATGEQGRHITSHAQRLVIDSLSLLGEYAQECNVQLAVMPMSSATAHGWTFLKSLHKAYDLITKCKHPNVGLCLHSYHALQDSKWKQMLPQIVDTIKLVKVCDGVSPKRPRKQCLPGEGKMDLPALFHLLESLEYQGLYEIDTWCEKNWKSENTDLLQASLNWVKTIFPVPATT